MVHSSNLMETLNIAHENNGWSTPGLYTGDHHNFFWDTGQFTTELLKGEATGSLPGWSQNTSDDKNTDSISILCRNFLEKPLLKKYVW